MSNWYFDGRVSLLGLDGQHSGVRLPGEDILYFLISLSLQRLINVIHLLGGRCQAGHTRHHVQSKLMHITTKLDDMFALALMAGSAVSREHHQTLFFNLSPTHSNLGDTSG